MLTLLSSAAASPTQVLNSLVLHEVSGLNPLDLALLPQLTQLHHFSMVAPKPDTWLGLAPIRLLTKLRCLKQLEWIPCEKALPGLKSKTAQEQLDTFALFVTRGNSSSLVSPVSSLAVMLELIMQAFCRPPYSTVKWLASRQTRFLHTRGRGDLRCRWR